jgi:hypothetical protein
MVRAIIKAMIRINNSKNLKRASIKSSKQTILKMSCRMDRMDRISKLCTKSAVWLMFAAKVKDSR